MAVSQFTIYKSSDASAPVLTGLTGSLITVLDACLVTGYGSQATAGWTKPLPNTESYGCYQNPSGSNLCVFVDDMGSGSAVGAEARIQGWDSITSIEAGIATGSNQFPTFAQLGIGRGSVIARKSRTANATARDWVIIADSKTCYGNVLVGDGAGVYCSFMFGDIYSIKSGSADAGRFMVAGRSAASSSTATIDKVDLLTPANFGTATAGHFLAHTYGGGGAGITVNKHGDNAKSAAATTLLGTVPFLNPVDNGFYLCPVWLGEPTAGVVRGRMRGFYQFLHPIASVTDMQVITGSGDFPDKSFLIIKQSSNGGVYTFETSNTVETN